jgi:hypothetical protein
MHSYRERLRAPASWWIVGMATMFMFASIVWFGFPLWLAPVVYGILLGGTAALLLNWGRVTIKVTGAELTAGNEAMHLSDAGQVAALNEEQTRALRGPRADPRANLLIRPYLRYAVYIEVTAPGAASPYWLLGTRRPAELAAAIESSRPAARADGATVG